MNTSSIPLIIRKTLLFTPLLLIPWGPGPASHAAEVFTGGAIREFMKAAKPSADNVPMSTPDSIEWVEEIRNYLAIYKANYPGSNFTPYLAKLDLAQDAVGRGDRRVVRHEMGAFFKMFAKRDHGIGDVAADELTNFSQMVTPIAAEYGIPVPRFGAGR
jgi:hypothetical protein